MKVLQINSVCGYGSTGRIITDLYDILAEQGHDCLIAYGRYSALKRYKSYKIDTDFEVKLNGLKTRLTDKEGFGSQSATEKLIQKIKEYDPDVIHLHNLHGYYLNIEILFHYLTQADKPVIWTLHDCWSFTGHCTHFDYIECEKWKTGCEYCPQKHTYPKSYLMDASKWNYQKKQELFTSVNNMIIVTPSHWLAGLVKQSYLSKYPVEVIHNGIDLNLFKPIKSDFRTKYDLEDKTIVLGVASVWCQRKGLETLIALSQKLPTNYKIVLVGLSEKQMREIPKEILGLMRTDSVQELAEIYTAADVFVNPTLEDNFPTTNLEALACGTPVITYDTGGSPESLDNNCGKVVEKNNIKEIINVLVKKKYKSSKEDCIKRSIHFNKIIRFNEYIELYKKW